MTLPSLLLLLLQLGEAVAVPPGPARQRVFDLRAYGGRGDNRTMNTRAFERAVAAIAAAGGGELRVPPGIYRTAGFALTSNMTLFLERATVVGHVPNFSRSTHGMCSGKPRCYSAEGWRPRTEVCSSYSEFGWHPPGTPNDQVDERRTGYQPLLLGLNVSDVHITGDRGTLTWSDLPRWHALHQVAALAYGRPHTVLFSRSRNVAVSNLSVLMSPFWSVRFWASQGVVARDLTIVNRRDIFNGDGVDVDSTSDALVERIVYSGGDDAVALKSGMGREGAEFNRSTRNVTIRDIVATTRASCWCAGSEVEGGVHDVVVRNVTCNNCVDGMRFKTAHTVSGNIASNLSFEHIRMVGIAGTAISVTGFRDVRMRDVVGSQIALAGQFSHGEGLHLRDIDLQAKQPFECGPSLSGGSASGTIQPASCFNTTRRRVTVKADDSDALATAAAGRDTLSFDYGWRFHLGDPAQPPPPPPAPPNCAKPSEVFTANVTGRQYTGLGTDASASSAEECAAACCRFHEAFQPRCWVWQWAANAPANWSSRPRCWLGAPKDKRVFTNSSIWVGFSRATPPPPGPSPPLPRNPPAAAAGFDDSGWERVDTPHDMLMASPYDPDTPPAGVSSAHVFSPHSGPPGGIGMDYRPRNVGWYRKRFALPRQWNGSAISLRFEGVWRNSKMWLNSEPVSEHAGYGGGCKCSRSLYVFCRSSKKAAAQTRASTSGSTTRRA